jgi:hypothetical protein
MVPLTKLLFPIQRPLVTGSRLGVSAVAFFARIPERVRGALLTHDDDRPFDAFDGSVPLAESEAEQDGWGTVDSLLACVSDESYLAAGEPPLKSPAARYRLIDEFARLQTLAAELIDKYRAIDVVFDTLVDAMRATARKAVDDAGMHGPSGSTQFVCDDHRLVAELDVRN